MEQAQIQNVAPGGDESEKSETLVQESTASSTATKAAPAQVWKPAEPNFAEPGKKTNSSTPDDSSNSHILKDALNVPPGNYNIDSLRSEYIAFEGNRCDSLRIERENDTLKNRALQTVLHFMYTDQRLADVESNLERLQNAFDGTPDRKRLRQKKDHHYVYAHILRRSTSSHWTLSLDSLKIPAAERPSLEVLITEHIGVSHNTSSEETAPQSRTAERLRIRYMPLVIHLQRVCGVKILEDTDPPEEASEAPTESAVVFLRPFKLFVTYEKKIRQSLEELESRLRQQTEAIPGASSTEEKAYDDKDLVQDLKLLVEFLDNDLRDTFQLRESIQQGVDVAVEYADLWHVFNRGDIVISQGTRTTAYRVLSFAGGRDLLSHKIHGNLKRDGEKEPDQLDGFTIDCNSLVSDGLAYRPEPKKFVIYPFTNRILISELPIFPIKFAPTSLKATDILLARGDIYMELTSTPFSHRMMKGKSRDEPPIDVNGQVIVDMTLAYNLNRHQQAPEKIAKSDLARSHPNETIAAFICNHNQVEGCCGGDVVHDDLEMDTRALDRYIQANAHRLKRQEAFQLDGEDRLLLADWVYAFVLRSRRWVKVPTSDLEPVHFEKNFESLMLPFHHKNTIKSLVKTHEHGSSNPLAKKVSLGSGIDVVKGKGTGLVILLHGEPGTGKTMTAECVAEDTKRPLFPVTCGDIGETAMEVEEKLQHNFNLAQKWGCVLLLDEADVFLARRLKMDLRRNAVVSVFLRSLEYYGGILFLTTNRVGSIDPAFKSRIHMSLFYPLLDMDISLEIYKTFIQRTRDAQKEQGSDQFRIKEKEILKFAKKQYRATQSEEFGPWNGRQIRNAFQAAISLAENESQETGKRSILGKEHFETVAKSSEEFERYLMATHGKSESELAAEERTRARVRTSGQKRPGPAQQHEMRDWVSGRQSYPTPGNDKGRQQFPESSDDSSEDDDDEVDDVEDMNANVQRALPQDASKDSKSTTAVVPDSLPGTKVDQVTINKAQMAQFQEFLRFQQMQKKQAN